MTHKNIPQTRKKTKASGNLWLLTPFIQKACHRMIKRTKFRQKHREKKKSVPINTYIMLLFWSTPCNANWVSNLNYAKTLRCISEVQCAKRCLKRRARLGALAKRNIHVYESKILQLKCVKSLSKWITYITYLSFRCLRRRLKIGAQNFEISSFKRLDRCFRHIAYCWSWTGWSLRGLWSLLARKMAANMREATCARTKTSKVPTRLPSCPSVPFLFCVCGIIRLCNMHKVLVLLPNTNDRAEAAKLNENQFEVHFLHASENDADEILSIFAYNTYLAKGTFTHCD